MITADNKKLLKNILIVLIIVGMFPVSMGILIRATVRDLLNSAKIPDNTFSQKSPILVMSRTSEKEEYKARVVYYKNLSKYLSENPNHTFLVPEGKDGKLNKDASHHTRCWDKNPSSDWESPIPWYAEFKVLKRGKNRQFLEVEGTFDDDRLNTSWYEATNDKIELKYSRLVFGPGEVFVAIPAGFLKAVVLYAIVAEIYLLFLVIKRRKERLKKPKQSHSTPI